MSCVCTNVEVTSRHSSLLSITLTNSDLTAANTTLYRLGVPNIIKKFTVTRSSADATGLSAVFGLKEISKTDPTVTATTNLATKIVADTDVNLTGYTPTDKSYGFTELVVKATGTVPASYTVDINLEGL